MASNLLPQSIANAFAFGTKKDCVYSNNDDFNGLVRKI